MDALVKVSDLIAGTIAALISLLYIADVSQVSARIFMIAFSLVGLLSGWYIARERHWIMKIFLYAGVMVLTTLVANLIIRFFWPGP